MPNTSIIYKLHKDLEKLSDNKNLAKADILKEITSLYFKNNKTEKAIEMNMKEIELREKIGEIIGIYQAKHNLALIFHLSGDIYKAEQLYLENYKSIEFQKSFEIKDQAIYDLANLYQHYIGDYNQSYKYYRLGFILARETENRSREAFFIDHMGMAKYWLYEFDEAINYHQQSWKILTSLPRDISHLFHKIQLAAAYVGNEDFEQGLNELLTILDLKKENTDVYSNVEFYLVLSLISKYDYTLVENYEKELVDICGQDLTSEALLEVARDIAVESNHLKSIVQSKVYLAEELIARNKEGAMKLFSEAFKLATSQNRLKEIKLIKQYLTAHKLSITDLKQI